MVINLDFYKQYESELSIQQLNKLAFKHHSTITRVNFGFIKIDENNCTFVFFDEDDPRIHRGAHSYEDVSKFIRFIHSHALDIAKCIFKYMHPKRDPKYALDFHHKMGLGFSEYF